MSRQLTAIFLCASLTTGACASAAGPRIASQPAPAVDRAVMAEYAQKIPPGSKVRVERTDGRSLRGTLMKADAESITVQRNTRIPEAPVQIPLGSITRLTLDHSSSSVGKTVAIGVASGVGATLGVLLILAALWSD